MTTKEAKKIPIECYLQTLGFSPNSSRKNGVELWYHSPLKKDKTASFKVDINRNTWYDFGAGKGGSIIDFVITFFGCSIGDAFKKISESKATDIKIKVQPFASVKNEGTEIRRVKILQNKALIDYALERKIKLSVARKYLVEVYYTPKGKNLNYFALGFKNISGGYEIRNKLFKGCILEKNISFFKGECRDSVSVFEGFFDFLSVLTEKKISQLKTDVIVLNSITQLPKGMELIKQEGYTKIFSFLDNDGAGNTATNEIKAQFKGSFLDMRYLYTNFKDYNEKLTSNEIKKDGQP